MRRFETLTFALMSVAVMVSCSTSDACSLKDASGFEVSEITSVQASESVYQSLTWNVPKEAYAYLDCPYVKVDFDINATYFSSWPPSELEDDAYVLHVETETLETNGKGGMTFVISRNTKYMYFDGLDATYRSKDAMPSKFIDLIKADNVPEVSTESN